MSLYRAYAVGGVIYEEGVVRTVYHRLVLEWGTPLGGTPDTAALSLYLRRLTRDLEEESKEEKENN